MDASSQTPYNAMLHAPANQPSASVSSAASNENSFPNATDSAPPWLMVCLPTCQVLNLINLYLIDYLATHSDATKPEFAAMWKVCDAETKKKYKDLLNKQIKAKKNINYPTQIQIHVTLNNN
ncbi:hypothetical protein C0995_009059 [Termitomyces sp. Mi166|nr:hypothetical protein C0995_009059 [Termitomyces sp. Mi166\